MAKPRIYGMNRSYVPNAKADMRQHKKVYQRNREKQIRMEPVQKVCENYKTSEKEQ